MTFCELGTDHSIWPSCDPPKTPLKRNHASHKPLRSPEARVFLQNLGNYVAIGCLVLGSGLTSNTNVQYGLEWLELTDLGSLHGLSTAVYQHATRLLAEGLIRAFILSDREGLKHIIRIYVLPSDVGHRHVDHNDRKITTCLQALILELDVSPQAWNGHVDETHSQRFPLWADRDEGSLYYMFNKLPSPSPSLLQVKDKFRRKAMLDLLGKSRQHTAGLKASLYPYQQRSAALMLQRESETRLELDPRLEARVAPDGTEYYYGPRDTTFLSSPKFFESCKGGILAETMGLGKTVICIALMLSTKGHLPKIPVQYSEPLPTRSEVASLTKILVSAINRHYIPWKSYFDDIENRTGDRLSQCTDLLRASPPTYAIPVEPIRFNRKTTTPPPKRLMLAATTIVVVPRNLFSQWKSEFNKHAEPSSLTILYMDDPKTPLPSPQELALYDTILFSRSRFEQEIKDGSDQKGRRAARYPVSCNCPYIGATRTRDCVCLREEDLYDSPLKHVHFLRIIIDEGHSFSSASTTAAQVASKLVEADHRWVVSGTPAKDLLGIEMDLSAAQSCDTTTSEQSLRAQLLDQRRDFSIKEDTTGAIRSIGSFARHFLKIRPWAPSEDERPIDWEDYVFRHEDFRKRTFSGFSKCLRRTLESIVIKTQPEDVERDIVLPPLTHNIIRLEPSYYDKLTANTFIFVLTANAVTSERSDVDYLFHKNSHKARCQLVSNLRQSAFFWTGFSKDDIEAAIKHSQKYLGKDSKCSREDRAMLQECVKDAQRMVLSNGWNALSTSHEVGFFLEHWPRESAEFWSFDNSSGTMMCGASQLLDAQNHVNQRLTASDPAEGLNGVGLRSLAVLHNQSMETGSDSMLAKAGIPNSSVTTQASLKRAFVAKTSPDRKRAQPSKDAIKSPNDFSPSQNLDSKTIPSDRVQELSSDSPLRDTAMIGTTSAKLSYLLSQVLRYYQEEKILIFYDGDNIAWYIAQALELLHINHLIYAKSLNSTQKSSYIVKFDQELHFRVLLMDLSQAAFGLNLSSASRVFFVNPVCRPDIEAQAIKRAHRIGQTKKVVVETLMLRGTVEERVFERAMHMTRAEHKDARFLDDDGGIRDIIQNATPLKITERERIGFDRVALLPEPEQLWSRAGWSTWKKKDRCEATEAGKKRKKQEGVSDSLEKAPTKKPKTSKSASSAMDDTNGSAGDNKQSCGSSQLPTPPEAPCDYVKVSMSNEGSRSNGSKIGACASEGCPSIFGGKQAT